VFVLGEFVTLALLALRRILTEAVLVAAESPQTTPESGAAS
jgi:hypothetical protein